MGQAHCTKQHNTWYTRYNGISGTHAFSAHTRPREAAEHVHLYISPNPHPLLRVVVETQVNEISLSLELALNISLHGCEGTLSTTPPVDLFYPISTLPEHLHSTILRTPKLPENTHNPKETSFHPPSTLVPLLANYPHSHYSPPHLGVPPTHTPF